MMSPAPDHHHHAHTERRSGDRKRLFITLLLAGAYMVAEVVGGLITNSLALLADAGHMLSDVAALGLSLYAVWIAERPPTSRRTYGYYRFEILAALANGAALLAISAYIVVEAYSRIREPRPVMGSVMLLIAFGGLLVNLVGLYVLHSGREGNLNVRGAWLHVLTDALGSVGAILAAALIWGFAWNWADPLISVLIAVLVIYSAWHLVSEAVSVLMESAPASIDVDEVLDTMKRTKGVMSVHDLHVWTITSAFESLSAHVVADRGESHARLLAELRHTLRKQFGIKHITIQIEPEGFEEHALDASSTGCVGRDHPCGIE